MKAYFDFLVDFARGTTTVIIVSFALVIFYKLMAEATRTRGLLSADDGKLSPNSVQLLMMTVAGALWYVGQAMSSSSGSLPNIPTELLVLVGGSHVAHIGIRAQQWFFGEERERLRSRKVESP
jgi:hypothetical protein